MLTIAILGPGDLGTRLGALLAGGGTTTLTTLAGRSARAASLCRERGLVVVPTLADAAGRADIVISTVPPGAARAAASEFVAVASGPAAPIYVDANSIAPELAREIAGIVETAGGRFVSATVHGTGDALAISGQIFLSGADVEPVAAALDGVLRIARLGADPGRAKELKLLVAAMSKGVCALYMETGRAASRAGLLDDAEAALRHAYPAMMDDLDRMVPTYARHSGRRTYELSALADLEAGLGVEPEMAAATLRSVSRVADAMQDEPTAGGADRWTARSLIETLADREPTTPLR